MCTHSCGSWFGQPARHGCASVRPLWFKRTASRGSWFRSPKSQPTRRGCTPFRPLWGERTASGRSWLRSPKSQPARHGCAPFRPLWFKRNASRRSWLRSPKSQPARHGCAPFRPLWGERTASRRSWLRWPKSPPARHCSSLMICGTAEHGWLRRLCCPFAQPLSRRRQRTCQAPDRSEPAPNQQIRVAHCPHPTRYNGYRRQASAKAVGAFLSLCLATLSF
jgi:hypothetical protein